MLSLKSKQQITMTLSSFKFAVVLLYLLNNCHSSDSITLPNATTTISRSTTKLPPTQDYTNTDNVMPLRWKNFCIISNEPNSWKFRSINNTNVVNVICRLTTKSQKPSLNDYRDWINNDSYNHNRHLKYSLTFICDNVDQTVSLPWPVKAKQLIAASVHGCTITEYNSEFLRNDLDEFADELLYYENVNVTLESDVAQMKRIVHNVHNLLQEVECGSLALEYVKFMHIKHSRIPGVEIPSNTTMYNETHNELSKTLRKNIKRVRHYCDYKSIEEIHLITLDRFTAGMITSNSVFENLRLLNLSHAGLASVPVPNMLGGWRSEYFPRLQHFDLSHNKITSFRFIDFDDFPSKYGKGIIDLSYNNISTLTLKDFRVMSFLKTVVINLRHNPLNCSCSSIRDLYTFMNENPNFTKINFDDYSYLRHWVCDNPPALAGKKLSELTDADVSCVVFPVSMKITIGVLCAIVVVLSAVIFTLVRYRKDIVILLYTRFDILVPCQTADANDNKHFDAFISYSSGDEQWVYKTLAKRLESPNSSLNHAPLSLCLHHRDFVVGEVISKNITDSIEASRHTILVLSRNFIESEWCHFEFRTALQQSLSDKTRHLVIIVLDDVDSLPLDSDLQKCLKTFTYIRVQDRLFWDRLFFCLADKAKSKTRIRYDKPKGAARNPGERAKLSSIFGRFRDKKLTRENVMNKSIDLKRKDHKDDTTENV